MSEASRGFPRMKFLFGIEWEAGSEEGQREFKTSCTTGTLAFRGGGWGGRGGVWTGKKTACETCGNQFCQYPRRWWGKFIPFAMTKETITEAKKKIDGDSVAMKPDRDELRPKTNHPNG